jgi:hypothetical protein
MIDNAPLTGAVFRSDSTKVLSLLHSLVNDTDAKVWIKGSNCGRVAMHQLQTHYDGDAEANKRKKGADQADLKALFYKYEAIFLCFGKYIIRMTKCFHVMEKYKKPYYEEEDNIAPPIYVLYKIIRKCLKNDYLKSQKKIRTIYIHT